MSPRPDRAVIEADVELIHSWAARASGKLILATFGENPETGNNVTPRIRSFSVGDDASMTEAAVALAAETHRNVYVSFATMRHDLRSGKKGGESDIERVFGLVADFDAREDPRAHEWADRLPVPATMVLETSSLPQPSFQCRIIFDQPVGLAEAKNLAKALQSWAGCDNCTVDVCHVWRLAGTLNWPNRLKYLKHDRPLEPQMVRVIQPFTEANLVSPARLAAAMRMADSQEQTEANVSIEPAEHDKPSVVPAARIPLADLDKWSVPTNIRTIIELGHDPERPKRQDNSRSAWLFHAVCGLLRSEVPTATILAIITDPDFAISGSVLAKGRRSVDYARRQIERAEAETADPVLESFNNRHAVVENYGNKTVIVTFDSAGDISHRSFEDFKRSFDHRKVKVFRGGNAKMIGQGTAFIENPHRRQFRSVAFLPGKEADDGVLNLYRGPSILPTPGECGKFLQFMREIICADDEEIYEWLLNSIAHLYQKPWETPEVCLVLRGRQGVGKNFFVEAIGEIVKDYFIVISNPKHLVGGFNRHLMDKLLVFADEAFYGNEKRYAGILKNLVTQSQMAVEPKGVDVFMAKKYFRLIMASNEDFVVPADLDDRRMLVIDVSDARAKDHAYFAELHTEWTSGGREAFYDAMLKRDISTFNHRNRPETRGLTEQKVESLLGAERVVFEMLATGEAPIKQQQEFAGFIPTEVLAAQAARKGLRASVRSLAAELALIAMHDGSKREMMNGRQYRGYWVPPLDECRAAWARLKRLPIEWPNDDGEWIDTSYNDPLA